MYITESLNSYQVIKLSKIYVFNNIYWPRCASSLMSTCSALSITTRGQLVVVRIRRILPALPELRAALQRRNVLPDDTENSQRHDY